MPIFCLGLTDEPEENNKSPDSTGEQQPLEREQTTSPEKQSSNQPEPVVEQKPMLTPPVKEQKPLKSFAEVLKELKEKYLKLLRFFREVPKEDQEEK